jgi:hypothetical protein
MLTFPIATPVPQATDDLVHLQAEFHGYLSQDGSLRRAAEAMLKRNADPRFIVRECLRNHTLTLGPSTEVLEEMDVDGQTETDIAIALQRAALLQHRDDLLGALAARDAVLLDERRYLEGVKASGALASAGDAADQIDRQLRHVDACRTDCATIARLTLEQRAMREVADLTHASGETPTVSMVTQMCAVANSRVAPVLPSLLNGAPLRAALAADLALEEASREPRVAAPVRTPSAVANPVTASARAAAGR